MKSMFIISGLVLFVLFSCETDTDTISASEDAISQKEQLATQNKKGEDGAITYEAHLHHIALTYELQALNINKKKLQEEIENGNEEAIPKLEEVQQAIKKTATYLNYSEMTIGKLPIPPAPKPTPCNDPKVLNCPVPGLKANIAIFEKQGLEEFSFIITTADGEPVFKSGDPEACGDEALCYGLEGLEKGSYVLTVKKFFEPAEDMISYSLRFDY